MNKILIFIMLPFFLKAQEYPRPATKAEIKSLDSLLLLTNRPSRDYLDSVDSLFFKTIDNNILKNSNENKEIVSAILFQIKHSDNSSSSVFQYYGVKKLLDLESDLGYKAFLDNFSRPNLFWYEIVPYYLQKEDEICKWKSKLIEYLLFSNYLEDKEFYKDTMNINKPIIQYSIFFNCDGRKFKILILDAKIASLEEGNKKKNLIAIRKMINE